MTTTAKTAAKKAAGIMTAEEVLLLPRGRHRYELNDGVLKTMAPAGSEHGGTANTIGFLLTGHVRKNNLGVVFAAETGYVLRSDPDTVRAPDASFISKKRIPKEGLPESFWRGVPDLAVEVVSPGDTVREVSDKVKEWLKAGTRMVWVVDPRMKTVTSYRSLTNAKMLTAKDTLEGEDVIPGFRCQVGDIF